MTLPWSLGPRPSDLCHILARLSPCKSPVPWGRSSWVSGVIPSRILLSCPCLYLASVAPLSILSLRSEFAPFTEGAPRKVSGFFPPVKIRPVESGGPRSGAPPGLAGRVRDKGPVAPCPQFPLGPHGGARWAGTSGPRHLCTPAPPGAPRFPASLWAPPSGKGRLGRAGYREEAEPMGWDPAGDVRVDRGPSHLVDAFWNANSDNCHRCPPTASACHLGPETCSECALPLSSCATPKE